MHFTNAYYVLSLAPLLLTGSPALAAPERRTASNPPDATNIWALFKQCPQAAFDFLPFLGGVGPVVIPDNNGTHVGPTAVTQSSIPQQTGDPISQWCEKFSQELKSHFHSESLKKSSTNPGGPIKPVSIIPSAAPIASSGPVHRGGPVPQILP